MEEMEIKSARSSTHLRFFDIKGDEFHASLTSPEFSGTVKVWAYTDAHGIANLFESMAENWRGWNGEKKWASIEGEFAIACIHDKLGHITLNIEMHQDFGSEETWRLKGNLVVDAGQLEAISKDAKMFFKK